MTESINCHMPSYLQNVWKKYLSHIALARHALKTKRVELAASMSVFMCRVTVEKLTLFNSSQKKDASVHQQQHVGILLLQK